MMSLDDHSARVSVSTVTPAARYASSMNARALARARLDRHREAQFLQLPGDLWRRRDAAVAFVNFLWNADAHRVCGKGEPRTARPR